MKVKFIKTGSNCEPTFLQKIESKEFKNVQDVKDFINKKFEGDYKLIDNQLIYTNKFGIINTYEIIK